MLRLSRVLLLAVPWLPGMLAGAPGQAQNLTPHPFRPGWYRVDDEYLPLEVIVGEAVYDNAAWPGGHVFYRFNGDILTWQRQAIIKYMRDIECVAHVTFTEDAGSVASNWMQIMHGAEPDVSSSDVGFQGGEQCLEIGANHWTAKFVVIHELFHTLGYRHEQARSDRDSFVQIVASNIEPGREHNFAIAPFSTPVGPYDFSSIMHYGTYAFTICTSSFSCPNGLGCETILPRPGFESFQCAMGNGSYMTPRDAQGLIARYGSSAVFPQITQVAPGAVSQSQPATLTISGLNFYEGSLITGTGVAGTFVKVNGVELRMESSFVDLNTVQVALPAFLTANPGCLEVRVRNEYTGDSNSLWLGVTPNATTTGQFTGSAQYAELGRSLCSIGDVDGDGKDDVVVGSPNYPVAGNAGSGRVDCFSGATGAILWSHEFGPDENGGTSMAPAGDWNHDGVQELIVGMPAAGTAPIGTVTVRSGISGYGFWFAQGSLTPGDRFGRSVASAGDVTGDGLADVIIGAPGENRAYLFDATNTTTWLRMFAGAPNSRFGDSVAGGFDMNGDGVPDYAVGSPTFGANRRGRVDVFSGQTGTPLFSFEGGAANDALGISVAMIPSANRYDGGTLLAGATQSNGAGTAIGYVQAWGARLGASYPLLNTFYGSSAGDHFGLAVGDAGDVDQDGRGDFLIGGPQTLVGLSGVGPGYALLYSGRDFTILHRETGGPALGGFGSAVTGVGDTDGDARPDIAIGAPLADSGCENSGYARVVHPPVPPAQRKIMLSEVRWADPQGVEITNHGSVAENLAGFRILWHDGTPRESLPFPSLTLQPGNCVVAGEPTQLPVFPERPPTVPYLPVFVAGIPESPDGTTVALKTPSGIIVDAIRVSAETVWNPNTPPPVPGALSRSSIFREATKPSAGRDWGLDANSRDDWRTQNATSMGLENRSSGLRFWDGLPQERVLINEIDDEPDYVELRNVSGAVADLEGWFLLAKPGNGQPFEIRPWKVPTPVPDGGFAVVGVTTTPPPEHPIGVPYVSLYAPQTIPPFQFDTPAFEVALYDDHGRLVDLVRVQRRASQLVHNHPRSPAGWADFTGAAARVTGTETAVGRDPASTDTDDGGDWYPLYTRTMGSPNPVAAQVGPGGHDDRLDVRLNEGLAPGDGLTLIINASFNRAGDRWSFAPSFQNTAGTGPFFGLGVDAIANWFIISSVPPWFGILDAEGSARLDLNPGAIGPGVHTENIFILQHPSTGAVTAVTRVIAWDT